MSPDVRVQYAFPARVVLYAQAKGGRLLNDFRRLEALNPYASPAGQLDATYEQLNAAAGVRVGTLSGFSLHIFPASACTSSGGIRAWRMTPISPSFLGGPFPKLCPWESGTRTISMPVPSWVTATATSSPSARAAPTATGRPRTGETSWVSVLAFKPAFEGDFKVELHPITPLRVEVGYRHVSRAEIQGEQADPVCNLYAGATYDLFRGVGVYARLDNLLDKDYRYDWYYPTQGINFWGGVTFRF